MLCRHPVESAFDFTCRARCAAVGIRVVGTVYLHDVAFGILDYVLALHDVRAFETNFAARAHAEVLLGRVFHEVFALDKYFTAERHGVCPGAFLFGVVVHLYHFYLAFRVVGDDYLDRI